MSTFAREEFFPHQSQFSDPSPASQPAPALHTYSLSYSKYPGVINTQLHAHIYTDSSLYLSASTSLSCACICDICGPCAVWIFYRYIDICILAYSQCLSVNRKPAFLTQGSNVWSLCFCKVLLFLSLDPWTTEPFHCINIHCKLLWMF